MSDSIHAGWTSAVGPLPASILPPAEGVLDAPLQTIARCLADLPTALRETLISDPRAEISEGLAKAYLAGRQAACSNTPWGPVPPPANCRRDATAKATQCPQCRTYQWSPIAPGPLEGDFQMTCLLCGPVRWRVEVRNRPDVEIPRP